MIFGLTLTSADSTPDALRAVPAQVTAATPINAIVRLNICLSVHFSSTVTFSIFPVNLNGGV